MSKKLELESGYKILIDDEHEQITCKRQRNLYVYELEQISSKVCEVEAQTFW